jgi:hypothetical protein
MVLIWRFGENGLTVHSFRAGISFTLGRMEQAVERTGVPRQRRHGTIRLDCNGPRTHP